MKETKNELLQFVDNIFKKVLEDPKLCNWYNNLSDVEKANAELMAKTIALQVKTTFDLELKPINIKNPPKPIIGWYD